MKSQKILVMILFIGFILIPTLLFSSELTYDMATGKITEYDLANPDNPDTPTSYANATEVWTKDNFVGRLNYQGDPTTLTFNNTGEVATNTPSNTKFYFTYDTNGSIKRGRWREYFLVARAKGLYHDGTQHDFSGTNAVVANNGGSVAITQGAGPELVLSGQPGYNSSGVLGTYDGNNDYKYTYKYQYIWIDLTIILTSNKKNLQKGYYKTQFTVSSTTLIPV